MSINQPVDIDKIRDTNGRMLKPLPGGAPQITPANARTMAQKRWENYRRAAVKRIVGEASSIDPTISTGADAFGLLAAKQYSALMDSDKPAVDHLERLHKIMTGSTGDNSQRAHEAPAGVISLDAAALLDLADLLARQREHVTEQARAVDVQAEDG